MGRLKTRDEFILEASVVHGDRYDYDLVEYGNNQSKVKIICQEHGVFSQTPGNHLSGQGCPKCSGQYTKTTEDFVVESRNIHGDRYDYSLAEYVANHTKVIIICKQHGEFSQVPYSHVGGGRGCPKCVGQNKTTQDFIVDARAVHGERYDYSQAKYVKDREKVVIICKEHGEFPQLPSSHISGRGCPKCSGKNKTTEDFIAEAKSIHGDKYEYSKVEYVGAHSKVVIICKEHREFSQSPSNHHALGRGCPRCAKSGFDSSKSSVFYIYTFGEFAGFGITNDFKTRHAVHQRNFKKKKVAANLFVAYNMLGSLARSLETHLKQTLEVIDTGVDNFKTEAIHINHLALLLKTVKNYVLANRAVNFEYVKKVNHNLKLLKS